MMVDTQDTEYQTQKTYNQPVSFPYPQPASYSQPQAPYPQYAPGQEPYGHPPYQQPYYMPVVMVPPGYMPVATRGNGAGTAGFVLALLGLLLSWIPFVDFILWLLGLIFSFAGLFGRPKGLAIAGMVLSLLSVIIIIVLIGSFGLFSFLL